MQLSSEASAPGKLILFGEHAVVYGATAIAGSLTDLRVTTLVETSRDVCEGVEVCLPETALSCDAGVLRFRISLDSLEAGLRASLDAALVAAGDGVVKPTPAVSSALGTLTSSLGGVAQQAVMPALFLAVAILHDALFVSRTVTRLRVTVESASLPIGAGLGSSAAFSVATAAALLDAAARLRGGDAASLCECTGSRPCLATDVTVARSSFAPSANAPAHWVVPARQHLERVNAWAFSAETLFHGAPSGLDNTVATFGGALRYHKDPASGAVSFVAIDGMPELPILITNTRVPKQTSVLVAGEGPGGAVTGVASVLCVRALHDAMPAVVRPIIAAIDGVSHECLAAFEANTTAATAETAAAGPPPSRPPVSPALAAVLARLVSVNHSLLNALGVGHPALDTVVRVMAAAGVATKLTGAGGGGCALSLMLPVLPVPTAAVAAPQKSVAEQQEELTALGWDLLSSRLGGVGVVVRAPPSRQVPEAH